MGRVVTVTVPLQRGQFQSRARSAYVEPPKPVYITHFTNWKHLIKQNTRARAGTPGTAPAAGGASGFQVEPEYLGTAVPAGDSEDPGTRSGYISPTDTRSEASW
eukprot:1905352-Rhodomonas_salina.2